MQDNHKKTKSPKRTGVPEGRGGSYKTAPPRYLYNERTAPKCIDKGKVRTRALSGRPKGRARPLELRRGRVELKKGRKPRGGQGRANNPLAIPK